VARTSGGKEEKRGYSKATHGESEERVPNAEKSQTVARQRERDTSLNVGQKGGGKTHTRKVGQRGQRWNDISMSKARTTEKKSKKSEHKKGAWIEGKYRPGTT